LLTGEDRYRQAAEGALGQLGRVPAEHPTGFARLLCALDFALGRPREIAIIGPSDAEQTRALRDTVFHRFIPNRVVAGAPDATSAPPIPLLADRPMRNGQPTAYVCEGYVCQAPVTDPAALAAQLTA
jgi:uncharacterized protein YyaL (SSP411 family)